MNLYNIFLLTIITSLAFTDDYCNDSSAMNYQENQACEYYSDSTKWTGCTDPSANNYIPEAQGDDGTCFYDYTLSETFQMNFNQYYNRQTTTLENGKEYKIIVSGTYGIAWNNGKDAAFYYQCCNWEDDDIQISNEIWDEGVYHRPITNHYKEHHEYVFSFEGNGEPLTFEFNDSAFGDNFGGLTIEVWESDVAIDEASDEEIDLDTEDGTNYAIHFDYMSGYAESILSAQQTFNGNESFTVEVWYKNDGVDSGNNVGYDDQAMIVSSYRRSGGGDPYNNFNLKIYSPVESNPGKVYADHGAVSTNPIDDGLWHHIAATYNSNGNGSYFISLYVDGELHNSSTGNAEWDHVSSNNKIRINNWSPFAGDHMLDCYLAGLSISNGIKYSNDFNPAFPLAMDDNTLINLDFSSGEGSTLVDLGNSSNNFNIHGSYQWITDTPNQNNSDETDFEDNEFDVCADNLACNYNSDTNSDSCDYACHDNGDFSLNFEYSESVPTDDWSDRHYVDFGYGANPNNEELTMMGWFKLEDYNTQRSFINSANLLDEKSFILCSNNNQFGLYIRDGNSVLNGGWNISNTIVSESVNADGWVHYAMSFDGETAKMFINGQKDEVEVQASGLSIVNESIVSLGDIVGGGGSAHMATSTLRAAINI